MISSYCSLVSDTCFLPVEFVKVVLILLELVEGIGGGLYALRAAPFPAQTGDRALRLLGGGNAALGPVDSYFLDIAEILLTSVNAVLQQVIDQSVREVKLFGNIVYRFHLAGCKGFSNILLDDIQKLRPFGAALKGLHGSCVGMPEGGFAAFGLFICLSGGQLSGSSQ